MEKSQLIEKRNKLVYDLRQMLDKWEADNNKPTDQFDSQANALLRGNCDRLEKQLDAVEAQLRLADKEEALLVPEYDTRGRQVGEKKLDNDEYFNRFNKALFSGDKFGLDRLMSERTTVSSIVTNYTEAVPVQWQDAIRAKVNQFNIMRSICPVRNVTGDQKIVVGGALPTAYKVAEGSAITEDSTYTVANVDVLDLQYGVYVPVTKQYANDAVGGLAYVAARAGEALGNLLETEYTLGSGSGGTLQPGLLKSYTFTTADLAGGSAATTADISANDIIDLVHNVPAQYRRNANFKIMTSDAALKATRKLKTTNGDYIWQVNQLAANLREGYPDTLYGVPVVVNTAMNTSGAGKVAFIAGDFDYFEIFDRDGGMTITVDPYGLSTSFMNRLVVGMRTYGVCTNTSAFATATY